jgi:hypothetical protein
MIQNIEFKEIKLNLKGLKLGHKNKSETDVVFSEISKIYIAFHKESNHFGLCLIILFFCAVIILFNNDINFRLAIAPISLIIANRFEPFFYSKKCTLTISLKNGNLFKQKIALQNKDEIISFIQIVRCEIYNYKVKSSSFTN